MTLHIYTSTVQDGSMKIINPSEAATVKQNQIQFLENHNIAPSDTTNLYVTYDRDNYCQYATISDAERGRGITQAFGPVHDALVVTKPGHALFLALADCVGTVLYDPSHEILMVSHLGRHSIEQNGGARSVEYLAQKHQSDPKELQVWLSPAAGKTNYPLHAFDGRSLHEVASEQLLGVGVTPENLEISPIDTTTDTEYFSHSQFRAGNRPSDGRFAIVAIME